MYVLCVTRVCVCERACRYVVRVFMYVEKRACAYVVYVCACGKELKKMHAHMCVCLRDGEHIHWLACVRVFVCMRERGSSRPLYVRAFS